MSEVQDPMSLAAQVAFYKRQIAEAKVLAQTAIRVAISEDVKAILKYMGKMLDEQPPEISNS